MSRLHQNNFGTNLTSNQVAGVTTTPLNSIPSIAAPFYLAFDATNTNGNYEVVDVTSKTATHVNHAATTNAHTTAEEVRMIVPAVELDSFVSTPGTAGVISLNAPQGFLINGKISVTDASGITVALKTLAGTDPSATDPVYCRIGDTIYTISSALSCVKADGTNWLNAGSAELATKEIDYFVYLIPITGGVGIGFARIPSATKYDGFVASETDEKGRLFSSLTGVGADTAVEVVGRFAATLSAGAGYTWSVPTYTAINLIQRPIYETRAMDFVITPTGNMTVATLVQTLAKFKLVGKRCKVDFNFTVTTSAGPGNEIRFVTPFTPDSTSYMWGTAAADSTSVGGWAYMGASNGVYCRRYDSSNWGTGAGRGPQGVIEYGI